MSEQTGTDVATQAPILSDDALRDVDSMQAALRLLQDSGVDAVNISDELGDGFTLVEDAAGKERLVKQEFLILSWTFSEGDYGADFVSMRIVTAEGGKFIVNDGGTGICAQLREYTKKTGREHGMYVPQGLRVSYYKIDRETKQPVGKNFTGPTDPATTFYLNTSK